MNTANTPSGAKVKLPARILYVGGDPYARQVPIRFLISCGVQVATASNGEEAWSLVDAGKGQFEVVITDHDTLRMGGIGLITKLRSIRYSGVIIILTDNTDSAGCQSYNTLGVDRILRKPVKLWELRQSLSRQTSIR